MELPGIEGQLARVNVINQALQDRVLSAHEQGISLFTSTLYVMGAYKRHLNNCSGFRILINGSLFSIAATVLRMQIDIALRLYGLSLVSDPDSACLRLLGGEKFSNLRHGKNQLRDFYLVARLSEHEPWIKRVYESTSAYVHLSDKHFHSMIDGLDDSKRTFSGVIGGSDSHIDERYYLELCEAFAAATELSASFIAQAFEGCVQPASKPST